MSFLYKLGKAIATFQNVNETPDALEAARKKRELERKLRSEGYSRRAALEIVNRRFRDAR
jgi:hypothetical protein